MSGRTSALVANGVPHTGQIGTSRAIGRPHPGHDQRTRRGVPVGVVSGRLADAPCSRLDARSMATAARRGAGDALAGDEPRAGSSGLHTLRAARALKVVTGRRSKGAFFARQL